MKVRNELNDCNISYYLVRFTVPDKQLCLGEGQVKAWFSFEEIFELKKKPGNLEKLIKIAKNKINNL